MITFMRYIFTLITLVSLVNIFQYGLFSYTILFTGFAPHTYKILIWGFVMTFLFYPRYGHKSLIYLALLYSFGELTFDIPYYFIYNPQFSGLILHYYMFYIDIVTFIISAIILRPTWNWFNEWWKFIPLIIVVTLAVYTYSTGLIVDNSLTTNTKELIQTICFYPTVLWFVKI